MSAGMCVPTNTYFELCTHCMYVCNVVMCVMMCGCCCDMCDLCSQNTTLTCDLNISRMWITHSVGVNCCCVCVEALWCDCVCGCDHLTVCIVCVIYVCCYSVSQGCKVLFIAQICVTSSHITYIGSLCGSSTLNTHISHHTHVRYTRIAQ